MGGHGTRPPPRQTRARAPCNADPPACTPALQVAICVGLIIAQAMLGGPRERPFSITDATLTFPVM